MNRARLIFPKDAHPLAPGEVNWEGTEYSKCGRTDKGVSAFGQVIGIRVRSNRPLGRDQEKEGNQESKKQGVAVESLDGTGAGRTNNMSPKEEGNADSFNTFPRPGGIELVAPPLSPSRRAVVEDLDAEHLSLDDPDYEEALDFDPVTDELPYATLLNRLLPPDIRILAWCPFPPSISLPASRARNAGIGISSPSQRSPQHRTISNLAPPGHRMRGGSKMGG